MKREDRVELGDEILSLLEVAGIFPILTVIEFRIQLCPAF